MEGSLVLGIVPLGFIQAIAGPCHGARDTDDRDIPARGHRLVFGPLLGIGLACFHPNLARHRGLPRRRVGTRRGPGLLGILSISPVAHDKRRDQGRRAHQQETECRHLPWCPVCFGHGWLP